MDVKFMKSALKCAEKAYKEGEVPIGAVVVCDGKVVGRGAQPPHNEADSHRSRGDRGDRKGLPQT